MGNMDINTIIAVGVDGFLVIFFSYALLIAFGGTGSKAVESPKPQFRIQQRPQIKVPQRSQVGEAQRPQVTAPPKPEVTWQARPQVREQPRPELRMPPMHEVGEAQRPQVADQSKLGVKASTIIQATGSPQPSRNTVDIEVIVPFYAEKLKTIGIETTNDLLRAGSTPRGQMKIAGRTGIPPKLILEWVNLARAS
jgi:hypothetical protein